MSNKDNDLDDEYWKVVISVFDFYCRQMFNVVASPKVSLKPKLVKQIHEEVIKKLKGLEYERDAQKDAKTSETATPF